MHRPEPELKESAESMLRIVFDETATASEVAAAASTLVEIVAPDILRQAVEHYEFAKSLQQPCEP